jgi:hypothetical protein
MRRIPLIVDSLKALMFCGAFLIGGLLLYTASYCGAELRRDLERREILTHPPEGAAGRTAALEARFPQKFSDALRLLSPEEVQHHAVWTVMGRYGLVRNRGQLSYYERGLGFEKFMTGELAAYAGIDLPKLVKLKAKKNFLRTFSYLAFFLAAAAPAFYLTRVFAWVYRR